MGKMINPCLLQIMAFHSLLSQDPDRFLTGFIPWCVLSNRSIGDFVKNRRQRRYRYLYFLISKAYHKIWQYHVLHTLQPSCLRGWLPQFLEGFLHDRMFQVKLEVLSYTHELKIDIPQGSAWSSTLFVIVINGVTFCRPPVVNHCLYVDDFVICYTSLHLLHIQWVLYLAIQHAIIIRWASSVGFRFSPGKTEANAFLCR